MEPKNGGTLQLSWSLSSRLSEFALFILFFVVISDFRRKPDAHPLIDKRLVVLTKICYLVSIPVWSYYMLNMRRIIASDWISLAIGALGLAITVKAKIDLGKCHTWAGYYRPGARRIRTGLYRYFRHPMYAGIFAFLAAGYVFALPRFPIWLTAAMAVMHLWIVIFLMLVARRESRWLSTMQDSVGNESNATSNKPTPEERDS